MTKKSSVIPVKLPKDKHDFEAIAELEKLSFTEIEPYLDEILTWVQDLNWPIASKVIFLVKKFGNQLIPSLKKAISHAKKTEDNIWAFNLIQNFLLPFGRDQILTLENELRAWWQTNDTSLQILVFRIMAENQIGDQVLLKKWITIQKTAFQEFAEQLAQIEKVLK